MARPSAVAAVLAVLILAVSGAGASQSELVITRAGDKEYHWPGCERIKDAKDVLALTRAQATTRGLKPHAACDPSTSPRPGDSSKSSPAPDPVVYVDDGRYYHKKDCAKLGKDPRRLSLDEAGRKYWPCPTCKPPIRKRKGG
jgi:hypothetical protein